MISFIQHGVFGIWDGVFGTRDGVFDIGVGMIGSVARSMDQFIAEDNLAYLASGMSIFYNGWCIFT